MTAADSMRFRRADGIVLREVGATTFLVDPVRNTIHELNPTGAAVWEHLACPAGRDDMLETFVAAFPGADAVAIRSDLAGLLDEFLSAGLVQRC